MNLHAFRRTAAQKSVDELAYDLEVAKAGLAVAKQAVEDAETALIAAVPVEEEGSITTASQHYRITTTGKLNRTLDVEKLMDVATRVPKEIFARVIRMKPELSLRDLRYVEQNEPDVYRPR